MQLGLPTKPRWVPGWKGYGVTGHQLVTSELESRLEGDHGTHTHFYSGSCGCWPCDIPVLVHHRRPVDLTLCLAGSTSPPKSQENFHQCIASRVIGKDMNNSTSLIMEKCKPNHQTGKSSMLSISFGKKMFLKCNSIYCWKWYRKMAAALHYRQEHKGYYLCGRKCDSVFLHFLHPPPLDSLIHSTFSPRGVSTIFYPTITPVLDSPLASNSSPYSKQKKKRKKLQGLCTCIYRFMDMYEDSFLCYVSHFPISISVISKSLLLHPHLHLRLYLYPGKVIV